MRPEPVGNVDVEPFDAVVNFIRFLQGGGGGGGGGDSVSRFLG